MELKREKERKERAKKLEDERNVKTSTSPVLEEKRKKRAELERKIELSQENRRKSFHDLRTGSEEVSKAEDVEPSWKKKERERRELEEKMEQEQRKRAAESKNNLSRRKSVSVMETITSVFLTSFD